MNDVELIKYLRQTNATLTNKVEKLTLDNKRLRDKVLSQQASIDLWRGKLNELKNRVNNLNKDLHKND